MPRLADRLAGPRWRDRRRPFDLALVLCLLVGLTPTVGLGSGTTVATSASTARTAVPTEAQRWVETTLAGLDLEEKAAQLVMVRAYGLPRHPESAERRQLLSLVRDLGVGGVVVFQSESASLPLLLEELQASAAVPLLVGADFEAGASFRIPEGTVSFPSAMAVGATRSVEAARFMGELTGREATALGIHWTFAPVADVNNNPDNPIINLRSFGEDPELVASMVTAFVEGAREEGMLTTVKHFPGHGDTALDSHHAQPVLEVSRERLDAVELRPFRAAIDAGVDAVMTGHLAVPELDPSGVPATLSPAISTGLLRDELGFEGLIVTDAIEMAGVRPAWTGEAVVEALQAGADVVLLPADPRVAVQSIVRAVAEGQLDEARLDRSLRRILETKARLGLHRDRGVDLDAVDASLGRPQDQARADRIARDSITAVRNRDDVLPLAAEEPLQLLHLVVTGSPFVQESGRIPRSELARRDIPAETLVLGHDVSPETEVRVIEAAAGATHVLVSAYVRVSREPDRAELTPSVAALLERLGRGEAPLIVVSYGSPWLLEELPSTEAFLAAYGAADSSQRAAAAALFGEIPVDGRLPVTLPGLHEAGFALELPRREMTLRRTAPEEVGFRPGALAEVDRVVEDFVARGAFPGAVVAVGHRGALAHLEAHGHLTRDDDAAPVEVDTLYDLASLTKVVATTTMAMILVDEGRLDLDKPVRDFLPLFQGPGKDAVTVRHLLTHSSGLPAGGPLYLELEGYAAYLDHIQRLELEYEPDSRSVYSDFGMILLGEILERVAGEPLESFVERRVFEPLGMKDTGFLPAPELLPRIAPTEVDAWRGRTVHGEVHDENTFAMGGVAGHAGLFGTAPDLARWAQMLLDGGVFEHRRIVSRETVKHFTGRFGLPDSTRALGFDTKSAEGSSAGDWFSPDSFGHLGFTGTSVWIDPQRELFVILLTNRVHPTRENILIREARPAVANAVVEALVDSPMTRPADRSPSEHD